MIEPLKNCNSSISFGRKIPIGRCELGDKNNKTINAILCEYDCKDLEDMDDFQNRCTTNVAFRNHILSEMEDKNRLNGNSNHHIYTLETENGDIAAAAHTVSGGSTESIIHIGADKKSYRGAEKNIISLIGRDVVINNRARRIKAEAPVPDAIKFYTLGCGFKFDDKKELYLDRKGMEELYKKCGGKESFERRIDVFC